jgi:hypothetical protein
VEVTAAGIDAGRLWVMPAGREDADYADRLGRLHWDRL